MDDDFNEYQKLKSDFERNTTINNENYFKVSKIVSNIFHKL
jgi:hypothetical protein